LTTASKGNSAYQLGPQSAKAPGGGCLRILLLALAVLVVATAVYVGALRFLPGLLNDFAQRTGIHLPGTTILGTGDVQVTLRWQGDADLDLHVLDPGGEEIWFQSPQSSSGGILDVDANGNCEGVRNPIENIYWPKGQAPSGDYSVAVIYYQACGRTEPTDYEVTVTLDGKVIDDVHAEITSVGENHPVTNFHYPQ
jgi:hypothetical protein